MTTTLISRNLRSAVCVVCETTFEYPYRGGAVRTVCSSACKRARKAESQKNYSDRQSGVVDTLISYPISISPPLPKEELDELVQAHKLRREAESRRVNPRSSGTDPLVYLSDSCDDDPIDDPDDVDLDDEVMGAVVRAADPALVFTVSGHGYVMDDHRDADDGPLLGYTPADRSALRAAFKRLRVPIVGLSVGRTSSKALRVLGSVERSHGWDQRRRPTVARVRRRGSIRYNRSSKPSEQAE